MREGGSYYFTICGHYIRSQDSRKRYRCNVTDVMHRNMGADKRFEGCYCVEREVTVG